MRGMQVILARAGFARYLETRQSKMRSLRFTLVAATFLLALGFAGALPGALGADPKNTVPQQVFDGMQKSFNATNAKGVHASYQWNISGPNGGDWFIVVDDG